jgi:intein-encoded DNA endonuclease-like protein
MLLAPAEQDPKVIKKHIIEYILSLRRTNLAYKTIKFLVSPIFAFYDLHEIPLNRKTIAKFYGEHIKVVKDRSYTTEEIGTALQTASIRMRMLLLILSHLGRVVDLYRTRCWNVSFHYFKGSIALRNLD